MTSVPSHDHDAKAQNISQDTGQNLWRSRLCRRTGSPNSVNIVAMYSLLPLTLRLSIVTFICISCADPTTTDDQPMSPEVNVTDRDATPVEDIDAGSTQDMDSIDASGEYDNEVSPAEPDMTYRPPSYPSDDRMRVNHLQALGTHNSYHLAPDIDFLPWNYSHLPLDEQLSIQGVRQFELDIFQNQAGAFDVYHILFADDRSTCESLTTCLQVLKAWSDLNPGHHPLLVLIEPKSYLDPPDMVILKLNEVLEQTWGRSRLVTPQLLRRTYENVRDSIRAEGWLTLGETRNRLIPILHTSGALRAANLSFDGDEAGSLMLSDAYGNLEAPYAAYHSLNNPLTSQERIEAVVRANHLVRTRADSDGEESNAVDYQRAMVALASGAHFISTDFPFPPTADTYGFVIPMGTPSRCNPISAPSDCSPEDIEALRPEEAAP
ncbi:MAG: Ca2+-dependent phosphoinositide-specific phospholipase C [Bradymonadia bacterium]